MNNVFDNLKYLVGTNIRYFRLQKNLSQKQLGEKSGLNMNYIGGVERGERNISLENLLKISIALEISIENLFNMKN